MVHTHKGCSPNVSKAAYLAPSAEIVGDVTLGRDASVWFNATIRGDLAGITIGENTNIQDNAVIHVNTDMPVFIGSNVTVAHSAVIHACTIRDCSLIGMGAIVLDGAVIQENCLVGAGALVPPNKTYPPGSLLTGTPARVVRQLTCEEIANLHEQPLRYVEKAREYAGEES